VPVIVSSAPAFSVTTVVSSTVLLVVTVVSPPQAETSRLAPAIIETATTFERIARI